METIHKELSGIEELFSLIDEESYSMSELLEKPASFFEIRESAGLVVDPKDYAKRVGVLLYQLPETIVGCIEHCGYTTPGLKAQDDFKIISKRWYARRGLPDFEPENKDKFDYLLSFQKKAAKMIPKQDKYTLEDLREAYHDYFERIFIALKDSTRQEEVRVREEADRMRMYV